MYGIGLTVNSFRPGTKRPFVAIGIPDDPLNSTTFDNPDELAQFITLVVSRGISAFGKNAMMSAVELHLDMLEAAQRGSNDNDQAPEVIAQVG